MADQREDLNEKGMTEGAKSLRSANIELEKSEEQNHKNCDKEVLATNQLIKEHNDI